MLSENLKKVRKTIEEACVSCGRSPEEVCLLAVSKTHPAEAVRELYEAGQRDFGENYVQELVRKAEELPKDIRWHMIGHLQRNKVKYIAGFVSMIHSVDSLSLAQTIEKEAEKCGRQIPILIEVNVAGEESKFGVRPEDAEATIREISVLPHVRVSGLMTSAPIVADGEENRIYFRKLRNLLVDIDSKRIDNVAMDYLSMGMSGDYLAAIKEGAKIVRVGTAIFGERDYTKKGVV